MIQALYRRWQRCLEARALWLPTVISAVFLMGSGVTKFVGLPAQLAIFHHVGLPVWMMYVIGAIEIFGAILLVVPEVAGWGALILGAVMTGAMGIHAAQGDFVMAGLPLALLVMLTMLAWHRRASIWRRLKELPAVVF